MCTGMSFMYKCDGVATHTLALATGEGESDCEDLCTAVDDTGSGCCYYDVATSSCTFHEGASAYYDASATDDYAADCTVVTFGRFSCACGGAAGATCVPSPNATAPR